MTTRPYWTPDEFLRSGECPYGRSVLYRLLNEGKIPAIRNSRSFVIPKAAWKRYLETCGESFQNKQSIWEKPGFTPFSIA